MAIRTLPEVTQTNHIQFISILSSVKTISRFVDRFVWIFCEKQNRMQFEEKKTIFVFHLNLINEMYDDELKIARLFSLSLYFIIESAYNAVQDILSVYGLAMSTSDIMDAFNKKNDAAVVSIRDLANSCEYFVLFLLSIRCPLIHAVCAFFPL